MKLEDLEKIFDQARAKPLRAVLMVILLVAVGIATSYVTHYVGAKAETRARHRNVEPPVIGRPNSTEGVERATDGPTTRVRVQSVNRGQSKELLVPRAASIEYVSEVAREALELGTEADIGAFRPFPIRWVVIQKEALGAWRSLAREQQVKLYGLFNIEGSLVAALNPYDSIEELGLRDATVLHLAAVEDEEYPVEADVDTVPGDLEE